MIVKIIGGFNRIRIINKGTNNVPTKGILLEVLRSLKLLYLTDNDYSTEFSQGIRWNDPFIESINLPFEPVIISEKDKQFPNII